MTSNVNVFFRTKESSQLNTKGTAVPEPVFHGAIFDLDGTLLNSLPDLADCMNRVLQRSGYPMHPHEAYRWFVGEGMRVLVERALPVDARQPESVDAGYTAMATEYALHWADKTVAYPGITELLTGLRERHIPLAVLTNKPAEFLPAAVTQFFPQIEFAAMLGVSAETPRKPDPTGALRIARQFDVSPTAIAYLGDSGTDMKTATHAGMFAIGVSWGFRPVSELEQHGARAVIDRPGELLDRFRFAARS